MSGGYRYGFNGMEADDEIKGTKNSYDFWARMYDPRIGRWLTIDPQAREYPDLNPYNFVENSPMIMNDPTGESGIVTIDKEARNITIEANIVLYGTSATAELAQSTAKDVQDTWNAADGRVMIDGIEYCVNFVITAEYQPTLTPAEVSANTDYKNNYIRVEETNSKGVSYMVGSSSGGGSNSGYYLLKNITADKSTTEGHEMGHGWGLDIAEYGTKDGHPADRDLRGQGQPGIMYARGTLVDPDYQWDPKAAAGAPGGTVNPDKRKVLQSDIDGLHLDKLTFDANGQANLGKLTNTYIPK